MDYASHPLSVVPLSTLASNPPVMHPSVANFSKISCDNALWCNKPLSIILLLNTMMACGAPNDRVQFCELRAKDQHQKRVHGEPPRGPEVSDLTRRARIPEEASVDELCCIPVNRLPVTPPTPFLLVFSDTLRAWRRFGQRDEPTSSSTDFRNLSYLPESLDLYSVYNAFLLELGNSGDLN